LEVADSIGAQNGRFYNGSGGTRINFAVQMSKIDNKDISDLDINSKIYYGLTGGMIDIKAIGTLNKCEENFSYKSSNLTALSYNEAQWDGVLMVSYIGQKLQEQTLQIWEQRQCIICLDLPQRPHITLM
jgi:hypothetical protein